MFKQDLDSGLEAMRLMNKTRMRSKQRTLTTLQTMKSTTSQPNSGSGHSHWLGQTSNHSLLKNIIRRWLRVLDGFGHLVSATADRLAVG
jgi:hypothetical protein